MIKCLGLILMLDGIWGLLNEKQVHRIGYDFVRLAMILIGFYLFLPE